MEDGENGQGNKGAVPCWGCMDSALLSTTEPCSTHRAAQPPRADSFHPRATHQATPTGFIGFLPFLRVGMYSTPSGSPRLAGS